MKHKEIYIGCETLSSGETMIDIPGEGIVTMPDHLVLNLDQGVLFPYRLKRLSHDPISKITRFLVEEIKFKKPRKY